MRFATKILETYTILVIEMFILANCIIFRDISHKYTGDKTIKHYCYANDRLLSPEQSYR